MVKWKERIFPEKSFDELKDFNLLNKKRKLVRSNFFEPKSSFFGGRIYYPTRIIKTVRERSYFVFLHEEYHSSKFSWQKIGVICSILVGLTLGFISLRYLAPIYATFFTLIAIFLCARSFIPLMRKEEYDADKFAYDNLKKLNYKQPSNIFKEIFFPTKKIKQTKSFKFYFWKVAEKLLPYHPKDIDRYEKLKRYEKNG